MNELTTVQGTREMTQWLSQWQFRILEERLNEWANDNSGHKRKGWRNKPMTVQDTRQNDVNEWTNELLWELSNELFPLVE